MMQVIRRRFRDRRLVRILERWVRMLAEGMSIGMRPSQGLANLLLSIYFDHIIKDQMGMRHMQRYCDDKTMESGDEYTLTHAIRTERRLMADARLEIKPNAQMWDWQKRPVDYLGYVIFHDGKVRSRRRRRELIGSFYGISKHAHSRHLFRKLTGIDMTTFAEMGFVYQHDGKKDFSAEQVKLSRLTNKKVTVKDFETDIKTREGDGRYVVLVECDGRDYKFFTNSKKMKAALDFASDKKMIPFEATIIDLGGNSGYMFQ
jgi:hypothetical protein